MPMKRKILWGIVASIISLSLAACSDDNDDAMDYYVRYTVGATAGDDFFISYNDKKGEPHIDQQKNAAGTVEIVIGPVQRGFKAELSASVNGGHAPAYSQIDVSYKGNPFVRKVHLQQGTHIYYTITGEER